MPGGVPRGIPRSSARFPRGCRPRRTAPHRSPPARQSLRSRVAVYRHLYSPAIPAPFGGNVIAGLRRLAVVITALLLLGACGGPSLDATWLLRTTKTALDGTSSFHFVLTSANVTGSGAE